MSNNKNCFLNALKALACIGVVFCHAKFPGTFGNLVSAYAKTGVALFFIISGYYAYYENKVVTACKLKQRFVKNGKITLFAFAFYFVWGIAVRTIGSGFDSAYKWVISFNAMKWFNLIVFNEDIIIGHLWFLLALLYCYLIMILLVRTKTDKFVYMVSFSAFLFAIWFYEATLFKGMSISILYFRNVWLYGLPVFLLGHLIHRYEKVILRKFSVLNLSFMFFSGILVCTLERVFIGNFQFYMGNILMLFAIFVLALKDPGRCAKTPLVYIGEKLSLNIYIFHWMIMDIVNKIASVFEISNLKIYLWISPIIILILSILFSYMWDAFLSPLVIKIKNIVLKCGSNN